MRVFHEYRYYNSESPLVVTEVQNLSFIAHWHLDVEMVFVKSGQIRVGINRESRILSPGDYAVCGSGEIHYYESKEPNVVIMVIFRPEFIGFPGGWPGNERFLSPFLSSSRPGMEASKISGKIETILDSALEEFQTLQKGSSLFLKSRLLELCGFSTRYLPTGEVSGKEQDHQKHNLERMQTLLAFLEKNHAREISLADAARQANLSLFHFSRLFNSTVGMSFIEYLNKIRVHKAESLIRETGLSITEIALECGFESIRTFNRVFKQIVGVAPSRLRNGITKKKTRYKRE